MMLISAIVATNQIGGIGHNGTIPWNEPLDRQHFAKMSSQDGVRLVMGRKTWESLPRPLTGRVVIILTRDEEFEPELSHLSPVVFVANSVEEVFAYTGDIDTLPPCTELMIAGGEDIYALFAPMTEVIYITVIPNQYPYYDTNFPWGAFLRDWDWSPEEVAYVEHLEFRTLRRHEPLTELKEK